MPSDEFTLSGEKVRISSSARRLFFARGTGIVIEVGERKRKPSCLWLCKGGGTKADSIEARVTLTGFTGPDTISNQCRDRESLKVRKWFSGFNVPKPYEQIEYSADIAIRSDRTQRQGTFAV